MIDDTVTTESRFLQKIDSNINLNVVSRSNADLAYAARSASESFQNPLDRVPAISGIAKEFSRKFPEIGDYVAGMWTKSLAQQLLWRIYPPSEVKLRLKMEYFNTDH
jgi:hypothetical protein